MELKIYNPQREIFMNARLLFTIEGCRYCRMYYFFIEKINKNLPLNKRIEIINCTKYHDYGIVTDQRIPLFIKYYGGSYPSLFINGGIIRGANSTEELIAWMKSRLSDEFIVDETMFSEVDGEYFPFTFDKQCQFVKKGMFRRKVECVG